ncbi:alpha/beta fold hydrolase [Paracraurococcus lichenis]|uniref:Alpha/beta hydrolase n=1 Tax=Paracraurococcus lichenis TaxID=3064888 RepID=A0ABT9DS85_9PROT|nr:alpha/beta hydrolase [Paracraurococcus sp. LOR1-02]MDO9706762.1 alpha/beta hydrolase [Paracraurococcus sp. LOR1-02]
MNRRHLFQAGAALGSALAIPAAAQTGAAEAGRIRYRMVQVDGLDIFYREAGPADAPALLLLHGYPTSSHMFRDLIPRLAHRWRVVAPDLPGFGFSAAPDRADFAYSFDRLAQAIEGFTGAAGLPRYALYVFDYGAPVGWRLATAHPERVTAIITQNGNAYEEGLLEAWAPIRAYWSAPDDAAKREALRPFTRLDATVWQYTHGVPDPALVSPDGWTHDQARLDRPGNAEIQLDLFRDYAKNVALYPAWQAAFRRHRWPTLVAWGRNDPFFGPAGAEAFRRDLPVEGLHLLDTGHFALETHAAEIAGLIDPFLAKHATR